jgi:hypothetical protein
MSFSSFSPRPPLFLFSAHKSHYLLPPLSTPALSHRWQASWPAQISAVEATRPSGPASAREIFHGPTRSRATPSGSLYAALFLCHGRCWRHGQPRRRQQGGCAPGFTPGLTSPCVSSLGHHPSPHVYKSTTRGP